MCSIFIHVCMCILRAETDDCIRQSPHKHKRFRLRASALHHSVLQFLWEVSCDILATDFLSELSLHPSHAMLRFPYQLSDCFLTMCLLGTHRNTNPCILWGILFQPRECLLPRGVSIIPFQSLSEKCNTVPLGSKLLPEFCWVWGGLLIIPVVKSIVYENSL